MTFNKEFLDAVALAAEHSPEPLVVPWPTRGNLGGFVSFASFAEWRDFVQGLGLRGSVPDIVRLKFHRAQKLYLLGWIDIDLIKAGELIGLTVLELALTDCYGRQTTKAYGNMAFAHLLRYMPEHDGLTDEKVGMNICCGGGTVIGLLTGAREPSLADIRNDSAHGDPFDGFPRSGLLELVRDLIDYAYRANSNPQVA